MYDKIVKIISQYEEKGDFTHPNVDDKDLYDAEKILNLKIPEQYVWFLKNYGHGGLDGIETLGVGKNGKMIFVEFTQDALDDIQRHKKSGNKPLLKKLEKLLGELKQHPTTGTGQIELLKHYKEETWSRRINDEHRLVYRIKDEVVTVLVLSVYGHYK